MQRIGGWIKWIVRPELCFGGLLGGVVLVWFSLTPSMLPRGWVTQGVVSGVALACGYGIGSGLSALARRWSVPEPSPERKRIAWWMLAGAALIVTVVMLWLSVGWQKELNRLVGLSPEHPGSRLGVVLLTPVIASIVLILARMVRSATRFLIRQLGRVVPPRVSVAVGCVLIVVLIGGFVQGILGRAALSVMSNSFSVVDQSTADGAVEPTSSLRSGGPGSLVTWDSLGRQGRNFVGRGPGLADLEDFGGNGCCQEPIRVYVGLDSAATLQERAQLAVRELDRTGAFDREVLVVFTATGTGYINPDASNSIEYLYSGDTALVTMQYSFLPSWISVLADESKPGEATRALWDAVGARLDQIPEAKRPTVFGFGESLGSFGFENGFETISRMQDRTDGVLLIGPTFDNPIRQQVTRTREAGSPEWKPAVTEAPGVYFAQQPSDLPPPPGSGDPPRVVYLQNASDPVTWWNPGLVALQPDWDDPPYAVDRSPSFDWMPVVSFWQIVGDLPGAGNVPGGHGHIFGANIVNGWLALGTPSGWTDGDTERLRTLIGSRR